MKRFWSLFERLVVALESIAASLKKIDRAVRYMDIKGESVPGIRVCGAITTYEQNQMYR
jgi:hypothetical protein